MKNLPNIEPKEALIALERIIEASISDIKKQQELKTSLHEVYKTRNIIPAKGILADCHKYGDKELSTEIGELIKDVFFCYG